MRKVYLSFSNYMRLKSYLQHNSLEFFPQIKEITEILRFQVGHLGLLEVAIITNKLVDPSFNCNKSKVKFLIRIWNMKM